MLKKAEEFARNAHKGRFRKDDKTPEIEHPKKVVEYLNKYCNADDKTQAIGWLHDTDEDNKDVNYDILNEEFGKEIADGVHILSRNVEDDEYNKRIAQSPENIQMVKLCDTLHNVETLGELDEKGIEKKVKDCNELYIPLAERICPPIANEIKKHLKRYSDKKHSND